MEERREEPRKRNPFSVLSNSLNEIREHCGWIRKVVRGAYALVGAEGEDTLIETLEGLPQKQNVNNLREKNYKLKEELADEKKANSVGIAKLVESLELVKKMEGVAQQPTEILNKAKLFDKGLAKNPVTAAKVIPVLVDFNQKMEELLLDMRALFDGLEVEGLVPLDQVPNISINTEELPTLQGWGTGTTGQTPTPTKPATIPEPTPPDIEEKDGSAEQPELEPEPVPTPKMSGNAPHSQLDDMQRQQDRFWQQIQK